VLENILGLSTLVPSVLALYRRLYWPWLCLAFTLFAVVWSLLWFGLTERRITLALVLDQFMLEVIYWNTWALAAPLVFWQTTRHMPPLQPFSWRWLLHIPCAAVVSVVVYAASLALFAGYYSALDAVANVTLESTLSDRVAARMRHLFSFGLAFGTIVYALLAALALTWHHGRKLHDEQRQSAMLRAQLTEAQLDMLKMQLQPHFLFNTLNTISATVHDDVERADRMLSQLGDFLRLTLDNAHRAVLPLHEELDFCRHYLQIQKHRLEDRLYIHIDADPAVRHAEVPYLILQPLVENAIVHGVGRHRGPGRVVVEARFGHGGMLVVSVRNTAPNTARRAISDAASSAVERGIGVSNTQARLAQMYGGEATFTLVVEDDHVVARIRLPYALVSDASPRLVEEGNVLHA